MGTPLDTYILLRAFVDELARCGMRSACTAPGSRSAPLVVSLARDERLRCFSHVDERSAGFFALGRAKAEDRPVAVACTSGTAAAELLPAAVEAHEARVPLLLLTADRPAELRENGAGQAIDQLKLFGSAVKWFFEVEQPPPGPSALRWIRTLACRAYREASGARPGPVHLNFPLREPLVPPDGEELPTDHSARPAGRPFVASLAPRTVDGAALDRLRELLGGARRGVIVAGRHERAPAIGPPAAALAGALRWPLLADPMSGARRGPSAIAHYDALLRERSFADAMTPDIVLRLGDLPVSKPLRSWLAAQLDARQVALDGEGAWQDPDSILDERVETDPSSALEALASGAHTTAAGTGWLEDWRSADARAEEALVGVLAPPELSEPRVALELATLIPPGGTLFVASSMPVRDIETVWPTLEEPPRVLCNRGANGIDGTVSSAFGAADAGGDPVVLLIGDVALAHDIGGLLAARRLGMRLTIVVLDNGGGGIFDFLAVSSAEIARRDGRGGELYETHVATPTGLDFARAAGLYGLAHERVTDVGSLRSALERAMSSRGSTIVEVPCERAANVALHRRMWDAVAGAISPRAAGAAPGA